MKIFLSWSGSQSGKIANALRDWIPMILQYVEPWLSSTDIPQGSRWANEIGDILSEVEYGIFCLTNENLTSTWLNYEAGAISKNRQSRVIVFLANIEYKEITGPLTQFQAIKAKSKEDLWKLIFSLNQSAEKIMPEKIISNLFENLYPLFESTLAEILTEDDQKTNQVGNHLQTNGIEEKVDEILSILKHSNGIFPKNEIVFRKKAEPVVGNPKIFIGSSSEGLEICYAIQENLNHYAEVTIWSQGVFGLSNTVIESIVDIVYNYDFAIMVFTPDDTLIKRGVEYLSPRDNVIFELGLFIGTLGRGRTFLVYDKNSKIHMPSDIIGVTAATFVSRQDGNLLAALMPVCQRIKRAMGVADN